jgi:MFS family permease
VTGRGTIWTLGLGAFGLAFSITTTAAYLPPLLGKFTDSALVIGSIIAAEGVFAVLFSLVIGPWSDTFDTPLGRRRPFMIAALGPLGAALALMPFLPNLWTTTFVVLGFYAAYYVYEPPYRGLYPDLLPDTHFGRAQSAQHVLRGAALGLALVGGGQLFHLWEPAPFVVAALATTATCGLIIVLVDEQRGVHKPVFLGVRRYLHMNWQVLRRNPDVRRFLIANTFWEGTFAAARTFVVLYLTVGLAESQSLVTPVLACVAGGYVVAAVFAGRLGDRFGLARVIYLSSFIYAGGLVVAGLARSWHDYYYALVFPVSVAAGTVMTLSWGLLFKLMPPEQRGAVSGLALGTKGAGLIFAPILAGLAIDVAAPYLEATEGYQVLWPACAVPIAASIPLVARLLRCDEREPAKPEPQLG